VKPGWRAYALKEALRAVFAGDLPEDDVAVLLDRFCSKASRSGLEPFVTIAKTIREHRAGIPTAVRLGANNAQHEGLSRRVRLIVNRAYGFHSAKAAPSASSCSLSGPSSTSSRAKAPGRVPRKQPTSMPGGPNYAFGNGGAIDNADNVPYCDEEDDLYGSIIGWDCSYGTANGRLTVSASTFSGNVAYPGDGATEGPPTAEP
jgi:hypothetical protein